MIHTIRLYIEKYRLLSEDRPVLVGLSGGADSVALLGVLVRLGYPCIALHCNFHLRGEESDRDEAFACEFAESLEVPFHKIDFDTISYAGERHLSIEMAARELRYAWFEEMRERLGGQAMSGIRPRNGFIVRPLLCVSREDILAWLADQGYAYMVDSTNLSDAYTRNFIRLNVLPLLEEINPSARNTIARSAEHLSAAETIYIYVLEQARKEVVVSDDRLSIGALMRFPAPETILYELLKEYGFTRLVSDDIFAALTKEPGKLFYSSTHRLLKDRDYLWITSLEKKEKRTFVLDPEKGINHEPIELSFQKLVITIDFPIEKNKRIAYLDYDKLDFPLTLRTWKEGDWFIPFGMKGRKKLSDYFSDHKFSRIEKERTWLLCSGDAIVWVVGERTDNRFRIDESTKRVLIVNFLG